MRIFYASDTTPNPSFQSNLWRNNLYLPLVDLGHDVVEFDYDLRETFQNLDPADPRQARFIAQNRPRVSRELVRQVREAHRRRPLDLFLSYFYDACVLPEAIDEIRSMGIRTANWYCNGSYQLHLVSQISPHYDWCLVPEKFRLADYAALGARPIYCQEAANPTIYKPYDLAVEFDVAFVGQAYGDRPAYIKYLLDQGIDVRVWGHNWRAFAPTRQPTHRRRLRRVGQIGRKLLTSEGRRMAGRRLRQRLGVAPPDLRMPAELPDAILGDPLPDLDMIRLYSRTKVNLGFSSVGETHRTGQRILQVRLRDFEVPMSGGFYMVEYMAELAEFFDIGKEVVCYADKEELAAKIKYYLTHDSEREKIRRAGHERCLRDHSWHARFKAVFREMGLE